MGEGIVLPDQRQRIVVLAFPNQGNVTGNIHMSGADGDAGNRLFQGADAPAVMGVFLIILPEPAHTLQHHGGGLVTDGAVCGIHDGGGRLLNQVDGSFRCSLVQNAFQQGFQLGKSDAAGNTLAAGLRMAQA